MPAKHKCPHPDCTVQVDAGQFACFEHWRRLPAGMRTLINRRYRDYVKRRSMYHLRVLREAQAEGVEFLKARAAHDRAEREGGAE